LRLKKLMFCVITSVAVAVCGFLSSQPIFEIMISVFSIVTVVYISEGKLAGCVCGMIFCAAYITISYSRQLYGLMIFEIFIAIPLYFVSLFTWKKNQNRGAVAVKRLSVKKLIFVIAITFIGYWCAFLLLTTIGSSDIVFDSLTLVLATAGMTLLSLRYVEQWYFNIASNVSIAILWVFKLAESISNLNFFISAVIFVICNIIGLLSWRRLERHNKAPIFE